MPKAIRWGVLGVAHIAVKKVIPAMQRGSLTEVVALASRDAKKAEAAAAQLGIPRAYSSYEDLLGDPQVDAIYNPLPNHLHVPWSILAAGRHQMPFVTMGAIMGGNVRVGLEDSLWISPGTLAESNAQQVTKARQIIEGSASPSPPPTRRARSCH